MAVPAAAAAAEAHRRRSRNVVWFMVGNVVSASVLYGIVWMRYDGPGSVDAVISLVFLILAHAIAAWGVLALLMFTVIIVFLACNCCSPRYYHPNAPVYRAAAP